MKTYKALDLVKIRDACGLDFVGHKYNKKQFSCCYSPIDMPAIYWAKGKKPQKTALYDEEGDFIGWRYNRCDITYILFKNVNTASGYIKSLNAPIKDNACIEYNFASEEQKMKVCAMLQAQLGDDYEMEVPDGKYGCIVLHFNKEVTA